MRTILSTVILLGLVGGGALLLRQMLPQREHRQLPPAPIERGNMLPTIEATETVEPEQVVDIGSQVNGLITDLEADYGSNVEKDTVLAQIDPHPVPGDGRQRCRGQQCQGELMLGEANLALAEANLKRDERLLQDERRARAQPIRHRLRGLRSGQGHRRRRRGGHQAVRGPLRQAQVNLGYCKIKSPVKGTIVDRRVNVGQTVVSSLSASSLFLLAKDLSTIQVWASVNEADIGRIHEGMKVHFKVDAYPNETFVGEVSQFA